MKDKNKTCNRCKQIKNENDFHNSSANKDGLQDRCKQCTSEVAKAAHKKKNIKEEIVGWNGDAEIYL